MSSIELISREDGQCSLARRKWLELLATAPSEQIEDLMNRLGQPTFQWLRKPQVGLYMVRGRIGGDGEPFNLGEVPVTRCALRIQGFAEQAIVGLGYTLGRAPDRATFCALADAMLQDPDRTAQVRESVLRPLEQALAQRERAQQEQTQSTRVEFFTLARENSLSEAS